MAAFDERAIEQAALAWLESGGWQAHNRTGEPAVECDNFGQPALAQNLRESSLPLVSSDLRPTDVAKFVGGAV